MTGLFVCPGAGKVICGLEQLNVVLEKSVPIEPAAIRRMNVNMLR
jgi:hypothetical protein